MKFHFQNHVWDFSSVKLRVFGILNVTPDSFFDGGRFASATAALDHALALEQAGADAIDLGGESTRPGASLIFAAEGLDRGLPVLRLLQSRLKISSSGDSHKAAV